MSAVAGVVRFDGAPAGRDVIERMTAAMAHRGPDGIDHWVCGTVAFGQCMLRTTPESLRETLPLSNENGRVTLVVDGRVDNREELARTLRGHGAVLRDDTDAELILRAYEAWGHACPERIVGEFVFLVWDCCRQRLFGARDAVGSRHFYYSAQPDCFIAASEIKGVLASGAVGLRLNELRIFDYLVVAFDRDDVTETFYRDIHRLPAGHAIVIDGGRVTTWRYWDPAELPALRFGSIGECAEAYLEQLRAAVQCRLRSTGPVGAMLSGGLDSSSIAGLIRHEFRQELAQPLKTFSLTLDERHDCRDGLAVQEMLAGGWFEPTLLAPSDIGDLLDVHFRQGVAADEPFGLSHGLTYSILYSAARRAGCRVVLDGIAGDLHFYSLPRTLVVATRGLLVGSIPGMLAALSRYGLGTNPGRVARLVLPACLPRPLLARIRARRHSWAAMCANTMIRRTESAPWFAQRIDSRRRAWAEEGLDDRRDHARSFTGGLLTFGHEVYGEIAFSHGVEPRSPLSDRRLVEFAVRMPVAGKLSVPWYKYLMRLAMAGILPESVRWRQDVGNHPGWQFYDRLVDALIASGNSAWSSEFISGVLERWIDPEKLDESWAVCRESGEVSSRHDLLRIALIAKWMNDAEAITL